MMMSVTRSLSFLPAVAVAIVFLIQMVTATVVDPTSTAVSSLRRPPPFDASIPQDYATEQDYQEYGNRVLNTNTYDDDLAYQYDNMKGVGSVGSLWQLSPRKCIVSKVLFIISMYASSFPFIPLTSILFPGGAALTLSLSLSLCCFLLVIVGCVV